VARPFRKLHTGIVPGPLLQYCDRPPAQKNSDIREHPCWFSGVTMGVKAGHLSPGAALWGRQIEVGMLRTNYEMSNVSRF